MSLVNRRAALKLAGVLAVAPLWASRIGAVAAAERPGFAPPQAPMLLRRVLRRDLADGAAVTVTRSWTVRFTPSGRGYVLSGKQANVSVDAPPSLAAFAQLEEARVEQDGFPLLLDAAGAIAGSGNSASADADAELTRAIAMASERMAPHQSSKLARSYLASLARSAETLAGHAPRDLFYPRKLDWEAQRAIALPDGTSGEIAVHFDARLAQAGGLLEFARRDIVTRIGATQRGTREEWALDTA